MNEPFTEVYDAIWTLLESQSGFATRILAGNRIKLTGDGLDPRKETILDADVPEAYLEPVAGGEWHWTNQALRFTQLYELTITSGDFRLDRSLFPLKWEIIKLFGKNRTNLDLDYVKNVRLVGFEDSRTDPEANRETLTWSFRAAIAVDMKWSNAELQENEE